MFSISDPSRLQHYIFRQIDRQMDGWTDGKTYDQMDRQTDRWMEKYKYRWTEGSLMVG